MHAHLIFPHQIFRRLPALTPPATCFLIEEWLFFRQYPFHQQKIAFHRATLKMYEDHLRRQGHTVHYIEATSPQSDIRHLLPHLAAQGYTQLTATDPTDDWLLTRLTTGAQQYQLALTLFPNPAFLNTPDELDQYYQNKQKYFQTDFYTTQRRRHHILLDPKGKPLGGKWSFDADNRERYPKNQRPPAPALPPANPFASEAIRYVQQHFSHHYGSIDPFHYPVTFHDAERWLDDFLTTRFQHFGIYEDAIVANESLLHHSLLSPLINAGILLPGQVIQRALEIAASQSVPLNSTEGFIRQLIGWREFIRMIYQRDGRRQRTTNYWQFTRPLHPGFYNANTGIPPVDQTIRKLLRTGYTHHIERLMILGNFMLLCETDPNQVYQWFMEMYIDAYDWVMVPNVYGMSQFADGGLMCTKPYISGSNYILKMSDYGKGPWQTVWDGLFWRFLHTHRNFFLQNPRLGMLVRTFDKMEPAKQNAHLDAAQRFLEKWQTTAQ